MLLGVFPGVRGVFLLVSRGGFGAHLGFWGGLQGRDFRVTNYL